MARASERLPVLLIVATNDVDVAGAAEKLLRLQLKGTRIVSVLSPSMSRLMQQHGIDFQEIHDVAQLEQLAGAHQTKVQYVLATNAATSEPSCTSALEMAAYSLVRTCALHASAIMLATPEDATRWAAAVGEAREQEQEQEREVRRLAAKCLSACAQRDQRLAAKMGASPKRVLIVGAGGREHALASAMSRSAQVDAVLVAPGNGGTALAGGKISNLMLPAYDVASLVNYARAEGIALVVVGPEQPLVDGLVDAMSLAGIPCFGPSARAAQLEASKAFSKDFMRRHGIRTADFRNFTDFAAAESYLQTISHRVVVKASGLAAGKGVLLPETRDEAIAATRQVMVDQVFGAAGAECVIEEHLEGEEVSLLAFCDGTTAVGMPAAQDHKRIFDGDQGPNTGGMGAYAPAPVLTPALRAACMDVIQRTVAAMAREGTPYHGVLYAGFMICKAAAGYEPVVLEYNCRFGDPETQAIMPLLEGDLFDIMLACVQGRLSDSQVVWSRGASCTVVCAAPGYPNSYEKGAAITGLEAAGALPNVTVFHAGTSASSGSGAVTSGGRVLAVTGSGADLPSAVAAAYAGVAAVSFKGMHHRSDIARRGLDAPLILGVLGSTRGTALQAVIDAIASGALHARIALVVSNKKESGILERAAKHGLAHVFISAVGLGREEYDRKVCAALEQQGVQLVLMVGYMRIVSPMFVSRFRNRCFNVHPSLLPDFAGGMDLQVHTAVLAAGKTKSGCTIHFVTEAVDGGPIVLQEECSVEAGETPESLKAKVQALEGSAFCRAIDLYRTGVVGPLRGPAGGAREVITYRAAGVDIDAGEDLVEAIKPMCKATRRPGCDADLGGFGGLFDLSLAGYDAKETILVSGTDGVGTKLKIAHAVGIHDSIGIDLVAMCVNDILVCGAEPLFFLDYYATGALEVGVATKVVRGIAEGCRQSGAALIGGETAEMAGMYQDGEYDLAGFSVGAVRRSDILPRGVAPGDVLIGLKSSGIHSNGYSLVRRCVERSGLSWDDAPPFACEHATLGEALLTPTRIYVSALLPLVKRGLIKGMAHITGGGLLDNLPRVLPDDVTAVVDAEAAGWRLSPVFAWLQTVANLPQHELLRTYNCGIGMVVVVAADKADEVRGLLDAGGEGEYYRNLGYLRARAGQEAQVDVKGEVE